MAPLLSNRKRISGQVVAAAVMLLAAGCPRAKAQDRIPQHRCAEYYYSRVSYLLKCCVDLPPNYPGPRFDTDLTAERRANLALAESAQGLRRCPKTADQVYRKALQVNRASAELLRSQAIASADPGTARSTARLEDAAAGADRAALILKKFIHDDPQAAIHVWQEVASELKDAGRPWMALTFLSGLPDGCCKMAEVERNRGDLYFQLGLDQMSAAAYIQWLHAMNGVVDECGNERSLANVAALQRSGISLPRFTVRKSSAGGCINLGTPEFIPLPQTNRPVSRRP